MDYVANVLRDGRLLIPDTKITLTLDRSDAGRKRYLGRIAVPHPWSLSPGDSVELLIPVLGSLHVTIVARDGDTAVLFEIEHD